MRIEQIDLVLNDSREAEKLKFFHFWFFYYVNNANQRFYKALFHKKYSFSCLFSSVLNFMLKAAKN